jgi:hypothetical protein
LVSSFPVDDLRGMPSVELREKDAYFLYLESKFCYSLSETAVCSLKALVASPFLFKIKAGP